METNSYALAIEWLELAVNKLENESDPLSKAAKEDLERAAETVRESRESDFWNLNHLLQDNLLISSTTKCGRTQETGIVSITHIK